MKAMKSSGGPPYNRYGRGGRNGVRRTGGGRSGKEERYQEASGGRHREKDKGGIQTVRAADTQGGRGLAGRVHEVPHRRLRQR